jgi:putative transposase
MAHTQILYQLVFSTKYRKKILKKEQRPMLYKYMQSVLHKRKCRCYEVGGVEDHVHLLFSLHPTIALSDLVKDLKVSTNLYIKEQNLFPAFTAWAVKYGAFTYSISAMENLKRYIQTQEAHHKSRAFEEEYKSLLKEFEVEYDERFLFE